MRWMRRTPLAKHKTALLIRQAYACHLLRWRRLGFARAMHQLVGANIVRPRAIRQTLAFAVNLPLQRTHKVPDKSKFATGGRGAPSPTKERVRTPPQIKICNTPPCRGRRQRIASDSFCKPRSGLLVDSPEIPDQHPHNIQTRRGEHCSPEIPDQPTQGSLREGAGGEAD